MNFIAIVKRYVYVIFDLYVVWLDNVVVAVNGEAIIECLLTAAISVLKVVIHRTSVLIIDTTWEVVFRGHVVR